MSVYAPQLATITDKLKAYAAKTGAKLLFGITSPMMANARADQVRRQPQPDAPNARVNVRAWVRAGRGGVESSCGGGHGRGQRADGRPARRGGGEVWSGAPESVRPLSSSPSSRLVGVRVRGSLLCAQVPGDGELLLASLRQPGLRVDRKEHGRTCPRKAAGG